jgi:hypothetical protein
MGKMKPTELMAHEIALPEGELEQWCENPAAQPQEVPAEQRDSELAAQYDNGYRYGLHEALKIWQGTDGSSRLGAFLRGELAKDTQPASAAKPASVTIAGDLAKGTWEVRDLLPEAAKPAEDGLEAHASYCSLSMEPKATECDCQPQAKSLSDLLCPPHANLDAAGHLGPFDNCIACIRVERDELRARERGLREKLEGLAAKWEEVGRETKRGSVMQGAMHGCVTGLRAILASHWPAQKEIK